MSLRFLQSNAKYHPDLVALCEEQWTLWIGVNKDPNITVRLNVNNKFSYSVKCAFYLKIYTSAKIKQWYTRIYFKKWRSAILATFFFLFVNSHVLIFHFQSTRPAKWYDVDLRTTYGYPNVFDEFYGKIYIHLSPNG